MTSNDEHRTGTDLTEDELNELRKYWAPYAIVYDPLKAGSIDGTDIEPHDKAIVRALQSHYRPNSKVVGKPECTVFVARLDYSTRESDLLEHFSSYGRVVRTRIVEDIITGHSKGYGFVEFETERGAWKAYCRAHKTYLDGRQIFVDMECERLLPGWRPRRLGGGFNGRKESGQLRFGGRDRHFKKPIGLLTSREILSKFEKSEKYSSPSTH